MLLIALLAGAASWQPPQGSKGKRRSGLVESAVVTAPVRERVAVAAPASGFSAQVQLGHTSGDGWEPAIAADRLGNVFVLYPQYLGVPGCPACPSPTMILQVSNSGLDRWNTYYRSSTNGGASWSAEVDISAFVAGYSYVFADGFRFPFGDYYELDIDDQGNTQAVWGEGFSYDTPGQIWYSRGR